MSKKQLSKKFAFQTDHHLFKYVRQWQTILHNAHVNILGVAHILRNHFKDEGKAKSNDAMPLITKSLKKMEIIS